MPTKGTLYVVATPIGNLRDISLRALDILESANVIAAEHKHISNNLLAHHRITTRIITLHQHNEVVATKKIMALLATGKTVALVTDAGTPGVSDPGNILVNLIRSQGYQVIPIPGANAAICALSAAGITHPSFLFIGFLPNKTVGRKRALEALKAHSCTLIFYEAPHRVTGCITDLIAVFGGQRQITIARELTKVFETIHTCVLTDALTWLQADSNQQKGEFVLLLSGAETIDKRIISNQAQHTLQVLLQNLPLKQAVRLTTTITGENKNTLYKLALSLQDNTVL